MSDWAEGYIADIDYTHGFYRQLMPSLLVFSQLVKGFHVTGAHESLNYCELGCGQGLTANLLAAANPHIQFHAVDFNPAHITGARRLQDEAGTSNIRFHEKSFEECREATDFPPEFDIIALHGIYSWVSEENRDHIVNFIRTKLKPGGLVYVSYNALPGWAVLMPLRRLIGDYARRHSGALENRLEKALADITSVQEADAWFFKRHPAVGKHFETIKTRNRSYLAHEYLGIHGTPFHFSDVARDFAAAKLVFGGPADLLENIDTIHLNEAQRAVLKQTDDPAQREDIRDYLVNQMFRRDVFLKGSVRHDARTSQEYWSNQRFVLRSRLEDGKVKVTGVLGEAKLQSEIYTPLLARLQHGPTQFSELLRDPGLRSIGWMKLAEALVVLVGAEYVDPCLPLQGEERRTQTTGRFNRAICRRAETSAELQYLASPVTGGGVMVNRLGQLFLQAVWQEQKDPVHSIWKILSRQGQRLSRDGKRIESEKENILELEARQRDFFEKDLLRFKHLGIV